MIFKTGINDLSTNEESYSAWHSMLRRCYSEVYQKSKPTYIGCEVSESWKTHSNFKSWFDSNYVQGWELDKDLLGNSKEYSENSCCFLPPCLNSLIVRKDKENSLPSGVYYKKSHQKYIAQLSYSQDNVRKSGHILISDDPEKCFNAYKAAKESKVKELANVYKDKLCSRAFQTLMRYEVEK